jgi:hypothetical protein
LLCVLVEVDQPDLAGDGESDGGLICDAQPDGVEWRPFWPPTKSPTGTATSPATKSEGADDGAESERGRMSDF